MDQDDPIESFPDTQGGGEPSLEEAEKVPNDIVDKAVDDAMETAYLSLRKYVNQTINALVPVLVHKLVNRYTLASIEQHTSMIKCD